MYAPARIIRDLVIDLPECRSFLTPRQMLERDKILAAGRRSMAEFGLQGFKLSEFNVSIDVSIRAFRRHFPDLDSLLAEILRQHLMSLAAKMGDIPADLPGFQALRREAYRRATRTPMGNPNEAHLLLLRDRFKLPPDLATQIEDLYTGLGLSLAGHDGNTALALLDGNDLSLGDIDVVLDSLRNARLQAAAAAAAPVAVASADTGPERCPPPAPVTRLRTAHTAPPARAPMNDHAPGAVAQEAQPAPPAAESAAAQARAGPL